MGDHAGWFGPPDPALHRREQGPGGDERRRAHAAIGLAGGSHRGQVDADADVRHLTDPGLRPGELWQVVALPRAEHAGERSQDSSGSKSVKNGREAQSALLTERGAVRACRRPEWKCAGQMGCVRPAGLEPAAKCLEGTCSVR